MVSIARDLEVTPQARTVLSHLKARGSITPMEAIITYGITRLAARVHELRGVGYEVVTKMKRDLAGKPYANYVLLKKGK